MPSIYFAMLEAGMSLIAVNLPSICFLLSRGVLESSLGSIQSVFSLRSFTSSNRSFSHTKLKRTKPDSLSISSRSDLAHGTDRKAYETFAMQDKSAFDMEKGLGTKEPAEELVRCREEYHH